MGGREGGRGDGREGGRMSTGRMGVGVNILLT